eukprot:TRINITY_DN7259_c0_g1_i1.p1 TRINITY_DN7259_c0_g1~~TRINITY_DN7259_c0_g1_i1.p1  ORF type:complete len:614 (-),score=194.66 TRINITY_DN7259_c0_g1_i1:252-2093(-)
MAADNDSDYEECINNKKEKADTAFLDAALSRILGGDASSNADEYRVANYRPPPEVREDTGYVNPATLAKPHVPPPAFGTRDGGVLKTAQPPPQEAFTLLYLPLMAAPKDEASIDKKREKDEGPKKKLVPLWMQSKAPPVAKAVVVEANLAFAPTVPKSKASADYVNKFKAGAPRKDSRSPSRGKKEEHNVPERDASPAWSPSRRGKRRSRDRRRSRSRRRSQYRNRSRSKGAALPYPSPMQMQPPPGHPGYPAPGGYSRPPQVAVPMAGYPPQGYGGVVPPAMSPPAHPPAGYPYGGTAPAPYSTSAAPLVITPGGGYQADGQPPGNWNRGRDRSRSRDEDRGRSRRRRRRRSPTPDPHRQRAPSNSPLPTRPKEKKNKSRSRRRRDDKVEKEERKDLKEEKRAKEEPKKEKKSEPVKEKKAAKEVAPPAESSGKISLKPRKDAPPPTAPREERAEKKNKTEKPPGRAKNSLEMAEDIPEKKTKKEAKPEKSKVKLKEASPPPLPRKEEKASRKATKADKEEMQAKIREEQQKNSKLVTLRERLMQSSIKVAQLQQRLLDKKDDFSDDRGRGYSKAGKGRAAGSKAAPADESVYSESDDAPPPPRGKKCVVLD